MKLESELDNDIIYRLPTNKILKIKNKTNNIICKELNSYVGANLERITKEKFTKEKLCIDMTINIFNIFKNKRKLPNNQKKIFLSPEQGRDAIEGLLYYKNKEEFLIYNLKSEVWQEWDLEKKIINIYLGNNEIYYKIQEVYALIRFITYYVISLDNCKIIHSAAVAYNDEGILLIGSKGSGKTTLTTTLLNNGFEYIASDRCFLWSNNNQINISGWIGSYRVDQNSVRVSLNNQKIKELNEYMCLYKNDLNYFYNNKFRFQPLNLLELLGSKAKYQAHLKKVFILKRSSSMEIKVEKINYNDVINEINSNIVKFQIPLLINDRKCNYDFSGVNFYIIEGNYNPAYICKVIKQM